MFEEDTELDKVDGDPDIKLLDCGPNDDALEEGLRDGETLDGSPESCDIDGDAEGDPVTKLVVVAEVETLNEATEDDPTDVALETLQVGEKLDAPEDDEPEEAGDATEGLDAGELWAWTNGITETRTT